MNKILDLSYVPLFDISIHITYLSLMSIGKLGYILRRKSHCQLYLDALLMLFENDEYILCTNQYHIHMKVKVKLLSRVRLLSDPMGCSLPGSSVHGIFQARVLEWVAIAFSRRSSRPRNRTRVSHIGGRCFNLWATREVHYHTHIYMCVNIQTYIQFIYIHIG